MKIVNDHLKCNIKTTIKHSILKCYLPNYFTHYITLSLIFIILTADQTTLLKDVYLF